MKKISRFLIIALSLCIAFGSCRKEPVNPDEQKPGEEQTDPSKPGEGDEQKPGGDDTPDQPGDNKPTDPGTARPDPDSGISFSPEVLDADQPCTVYFAPTASSSISKALYDCTDDLYAHIGVYDYTEKEWTYVKAAWSENKPECKFEKTGDNSYKLEIGPNLREYFESGTAPVQTIALVIRNADGSKQTRPDQFISVRDSKYQPVEFVPGEVVKETMPAGLRHGINYNADKSVSLVLYDLSKTGKCHDYVYVVGDFNDWKREDSYMMKRDEAAGCWWTTISGLDPDTEYFFQYYIGDGDSNFRIHDAYSELILDPWNDPYISATAYPDLPSYPGGGRGLVGSLRINRPSYSWQVSDFRIPDENNIVIYEMLFRDFTPSGDIPGALGKLDYLRDLGVTAVELMPIQEFEGNESWGYNPCSYFALDKAYGTREMYKQFIDGCHSRGMAVIVDVVYNQTTGSHPFARLWWNGSDNVSEENPLYNVNCPHGFGVFQDVNHWAPVMVDHVKRSLEYLLTEYKVDGFRFDLTKGFTNNSGKDSAYDQDRVDILKEYGRFAKSVNPNAMVILEHFVDLENNALGEAGMHMWGKCTDPYSSVVAGRNADLGYMYDPNCYRVGFMESHDEQRICYGATTSVDGVRWGVVGTMNNWTAPDIAMNADGALFVARNVSFSSDPDERFKIRGNATWDDRWNYGAAVDRHVLTVGQPYTLTLGSGSKDMKVPAAGNYDIWFSPELSRIWLMNPGDPAPEVNVIPEDALGIAMRRAGLAAAFSMLVPGPKMIWQFGEMGYDISGGNGDTSNKPSHWEWLDVPARKGLHDTYASLLNFRKANPAFFTKGAEFNAYVGSGDYEHGKFMFGQAGGKRFAAMGNFTGEGKEITALLPEDGPWYDYATGEKIADGSSYTAFLKTGEFRLLVNFK